MDTKIELYHDNFQNFKRYNIPKAQLVIADIPYNIGVDAYASNPMWYQGGDNKNGESKLAKSSFFHTDGTFKIAEYMHFCNRLLRKEPKEKGQAPAMIVFCAFEQMQTVIDYGKKYGFEKSYPLFFTKNYSAQVLKANMKIVGATEFAVVLYRDKLPKFRNIGPDGNKHMVFNWFTWERDNRKEYPKIHPTQKPVGVLKRLEQCGRVCYKSEDKITEGSAEKFVAGIIKRGHEAVLEHCSFTVKFICDRGVSHEIVRHRMASYCQESTRYCNYGKGKFGEEITVIKPCFWDENTLGEKVKMDCWRIAMRDAEDAYFALLDEGCSPQEARSVLPNSLKTEVVMTANIREWRHFLKLRCSPAAHPQMREVALILLDKVHWLIPVCFDDIWSEYHADV